MSATYREINLGKVFDGKSAYELAVENGYTGTLEEWLYSHQDCLNKMIEYGEGLREEFTNLTNLADIIAVHRLVNIGTLENENMINTIYANSTSSKSVMFNSDDTLSYTCNYGPAMYIGYESETQGIQLRLSFLTGLSVRYKKDSVWTKWSSFVMTDGDGGVK